MLDEIRVLKDLKDQNARIERVEERTELQSDDVQEIKYSLKTIILLLKGNDMDKNAQGMIGEVHDLRQRVQRLERWKERVIYLIIGLSFGSGWGVASFVANKLTGK